MKQDVNTIDREFLAKIRTETGSLDDLRNSFKAFGWVPQLPAMRDELGTTLVGNRRLKIAEELGIEPVIKTITFGKGSDADAQRVALAIASNIGFKEMSIDERKRIADHLRNNRHWTLDQIAKALGVSDKTIQRDTSGHDVQMYRPSDRKRSGANKPGVKAGRPRQKVTAKMDTAIAALLQEGGLSLKKIAAKVGDQFGVTISEQPVKMVKAKLDDLALGSRSVNTMTASKPPEKPFKSVTQMAGDVMPEGLTPAQKSQWTSEHGYVQIMPLAQRRKEEADRDFSAMIGALKIMGREIKGVKVDPDSLDREVFTRWSRVEGRADNFEKWISEVETFLAKLRKLQQAT